MLFEKILQILGGFHTVYAFLSVICQKLGLENLVVAAGTTETGSVDDAMKIIKEK